MLLRILNRCASFYTTTTKQLKLKSQTDASKSVGRAPLAVKFFCAVGHGKIDPDIGRPEQRCAANEIRHEKLFLHAGAASKTISVEKNVTPDDPALRAQGGDGGSGCAPCSWGG